MKEKSDPEILDSEDVLASMKRGTSPASELVKQVQEANPGQFHTMRQAADSLNIHIETLRRVCRTDKVEAPSKVVRQGRMHIWLLTNADLEELGGYFNKKIETENA